MGFRDYFNATVTITRPAISTDSTNKIKTIGSDTTVATSVKCRLRELSSNVLTMLTGRYEGATHEATFVAGQDIAVGDKLTEGSVKFDVMGVRILKQSGGLEHRRKATVKELAGA